MDEDRIVYDQLTSRIYRGNGIGFKSFLISSLLFLRAFPSMFIMWIRGEQPTYTIGTLKLSDEERQEFENDPDEFIRRLTQNEIG